MAVLSIGLAGCGRDADSVSPTQNDPTNLAYGANPPMNETAGADDMGAGAPVATSPGDTTGVVGAPPGAAMQVRRQAAR
jgi:hypothetical protein